MEYDGTDFNGWQMQSPHKSQRTVQGEITKACQRIFNEKISVIGSGRTDSGVHALGQVAHVKIPSSSLTLTKIQKALNAHLPKDIVILKIEEVPLAFHAQYDVKTKTYRYILLNRDTRCAQQRHFCLFYAHKLNIPLMKKEAQSLIGRKDFKSFQASDPSKRSPSQKGNSIRTIKRMEIKKRGDTILIDIEANGFLYKMARNIVGTLLDIGNGKLPQGSIKSILSKKDRFFAGSTAKAHGLTLLEVEY